MEHLDFWTQRVFLINDMIQKKVRLLQGSGGLIFELADEWWKDGEGSFLAWNFLWCFKRLVYSWLVKQPPRATYPPKIRV